MLSRILSRINIQSSAGTTAEEEGKNKK
jgi:hypothetical protein